MTALELIARSLRLIGVLDAIEPPSAESAVNAIVALNGMATRMEANGLAFGWTDVADASDTLAAPPECLSMLAYRLAVEIAPEYGAPIPEAVGVLAEQYLNDLRRDVQVANPIEPILDVPRPQGGGATRLGFPGDWYGS